MNNTSEKDIEYRPAKCCATCKNFSLLVQDTGLEPTCMLINKRVNDLFICKEYVAKTIPTDPTEVLDWNNLLLYDEYYKTMSRARKKRIDELILFHKEHAGHIDIDITADQWQRYFTLLWECISDSPHLVGPNICCCPLSSVTINCPKHGFISNVTMSVVRNEDL